MDRRFCSKPFGHLAHLVKSVTELELVTKSVTEPMVELEFSCAFNEPLKPGQIPDTVEKLAFGLYFNQSLGKDVIPSGLKELELACFFDNFQQLVLPRNLTKLTLCSYEGLLEQLDLPDTLKYLKIYNEYDQPMNNNSLPKNLRFFFHGIVRFPTWNLAANLRSNPCLAEPLIVPLAKPLEESLTKYLDVSAVRSVTELKFNFTFNEALKPGQIPDTVEKITFGWRFNQPLGKDVLPNGLKELEIDCSFEKYQQLVLPRSLTKLTLCDYRYPLELLKLPESLEHLEIKWGFDHPLLINSLPKNLKYFSPGSDFNQNILSDTIQELHLGLSFERIDQLPSSLVHLALDTLNNNFFIDSDSDFELDVPDSLQTLRCRDEVFDNFLSYCKKNPLKFIMCRNVIYARHSMNNDVIQYLLKYNS